MTEPAQHEPTEEQKFLDLETQPTQEQTFLETQYNAVRKEIEEASERAFKIFAASVLVVPTGLTLGGAAGSNVLPLIKMLLPLLLLAFYAMYWAQIFSTYRAGLYIRTHIEPWLLDREQGWESWINNRRYAYDAQVLIAFFLLSSVYYLGSVYFAVTAKVDENSPLIHLKDFLSFKNLPMVTLLSDQAEKHSYEWMLSIFYALAGFVVLFLVQLTPRRELEEDRKMEEILDGGSQEKAEELAKRVHEYQKRCRNLIEHRSLKQPFKGHIKYCFCYKDNTMGSTPPAWHMRLTIRNTPKEAFLNNVLHTLAAPLIMVGGLWWAYVLIQRFYLVWLQLPGVDPWLIALAALLVLLVVLVPTYYLKIGRKLGAKVTIKFFKFFPANGKGPDDPKTSYIVRTSLKDVELKDAAKTWAMKGLGKGGDTKDRKNSDSQ